MKVDVVVLTKNSEETLWGCLEAIYKNVPINRLIVVDGYSTDSTLDIINEFEDKYHNVILISEKGTRGKARQTAIGMIQTEWFAFVDSDVLLCDKWFEKAEKLIKADVGAIWGIELWSVIKNPAILALFKRITMKIFDTRGGTHDLLVRYEAIKDIEIPDDLHVFEDAYIKQWIIEKGFKVVSTYDPFCIHRRPLNVWTTGTAVNIATDEIKQGLFYKYPILIPSYGFYVGYFFYQILRTLTKYSGRLK
ncbi:MAG: glycosyltransferase family 2 protein [Candidatus Bathyarchaeota archaeon]|nr:MAG: glycosyltransferase family 2 protein [Candidatus Bathyarchaeota archaeon]